MEIIYRLGDNGMQNSACILILCLQQGNIGDPNS